MESLKNDFAVINAQHAVDSRRTAEITMLRILLRQARGYWVGTKDKYELQTIGRRYPDLADAYGVEIRPLL